VNKWPVFLVLAAAACHGGGSSSGGDTFVAQQSDFATFMSWTSFDLPSSGTLGDVVYPAGARVAFLNHRPPAGSTHYPVGTIVVKAIERGNGPQDWEIFAMAKRGGGYDPAGAVDWEFFLLRIDGDGNPYITDRGTGPTDDGRGDMGLGTVAGGYFDGQAIAPCNSCHGATSFASSDAMIGDQLPPSATAQ
jgi:hypothetical protein